MTTQSVQLYRTVNGPCPYRSEGLWENISFHTEHIGAEDYENLLNQGFRRSGQSVYHPICNACQRCIPIRVDCKNFKASKGQKRTWRKNQDLKIVHRTIEYSEESFELYKKYQEEWHQVESEPTSNEFRSFLIDSPVPTEMMFYYLDEKLIGIGWVDHLETILSSVYFIFDPQYASRRLGVFSILYEIEYCQRLDFSWLYLGYWVSDSHKMQYKSEYLPSEIMMGDVWQPLESITP